jgi:CysZ protein
LSFVAELKAWDGATAFFGGIGFVVRRPRLWGYAMVPGLVLLVLGTGLGVLGVMGAMRLAASAVDGSGGWAEAGRVALGGALSVVAVVLALLVAFSLSQPISGFALEAIVRKHDAEAGLAPWPTHPRLSSFWRTLSATALGLCFWLPTFIGLTVVGLAFPPATLVTIPLKFLASSLFVAWDLLDYPFGLRGEGVGARLRFMRRNLGAVLTFGSLGALVMLIPGMGLLLLPFGVAGASALVIMHSSTR